MKTFKMISVFFALLSVASTIQGCREIYLMGQTVGMEHAILHTTWAAFGSVFWIGTFYGIHTRAPITWKLGWVLIVAELLALPTWALSVTSRIPENDHPGVATATTIVGFAAVIIYWGFWWNKQKSYFVKDEDNRRNESD